jgi:hypothetical protein
MRYEDWDVLLFVGDEAVALKEFHTPLKEFQVDCHMVCDSEFSTPGGPVVGLPTMTCFIPSLEAGTPFRVSLHSWTDPEIVWRESLGAFVDGPCCVLFEARLLIDGQIVSYVALLSFTPILVSF